MTIFLTTLHIVVCLVLIVVVLLQRGKGAELGAVFGGGASNTVFGGRGAGNFLTRLTTGSAIVFMVTSMSLAIVGNQSVTESLFDEEEAGGTTIEEVAPGEEAPLIEIDPPAAGDTADAEVEAAPPADDAEPAPAAP